MTKIHLIALKIAKMSGYISIVVTICLYLGTMLVSNHAFIILKAAAGSSITHQLMLLTVVGLINLFIVSLSAVAVGSIVGMIVYLCLYISIRIIQIILIRLDVVEPKKQ